MMTENMEEYLKNRFDVWDHVLKILRDLNVGIDQSDDMINHPLHYQSEKGIEVIDVIEAFKLNFNLANAIKYILRSGKKGEALEDIQKAIWYLKREKLNLTKETSYEV